ncbi:MULTISPECIES: hypothetical protein [Sorangium]|uniref:hypothetical protein n=1 Tax=Sorangium TaxID=39643 RepID=UPI003D9C41AD
MARAQTKPPHPATVAQKKAAPAKKERPPHPATVAQKKAAPAKKERPPHPATVAQKKAAPAKKERPPHPATVAQKKAAPAKKERPPHPATVAQKKAAPAKKERPPHPATVAQKKAAPAKKERPPHPATVVQRAAAKKTAGVELDGIPLNDSGKGIDIGEKLGEWKLSIVGAQADVWDHSGGEWKASYYRISGDYHIKGLRSARRDYEKGFFNGQSKSSGGATHADERDKVFSSFQSDVLAHVPGYARGLAMKI